LDWSIGIGSTSVVRKVEIAEAVRKEVTNYFDDRGITVTSVGMVGGFSYENPEIQKAIDETVQKQQLKVIVAAELDAQKDRNLRITMEADAHAEKARRIGAAAAASSVSSYEIILPTGGGRTPTFL